MGSAAEESSTGRGIACCPTRMLLLTLTLMLMLSLRGGAVLCREGLDYGVVLVVDGRRRGLDVLGRQTIETQRRKVWSAATWGAPAAVTEMVAGARKVRPNERRGGTPKRWCRERMMGRPWTARKLIREGRQCSRRYSWSHLVGSSWNFERKWGGRKVWKCSPTPEHQRGVASG